MKLNFFLCVIALLSATLVSYLVYAATDPNYENLVLLVGCAGGGTVIPLLVGMGVSFDSRGKSVNCRLVSVLFFIGLLTAHLCFAYNEVRQSTIIVTCGTLLLTYLVIIYCLTKTRI